MRIGLCGESSCLPQAGKDAPLWAVDTGLMSAQDGSFKPGSRVGRMEVIRTWTTYQQCG